MKKALSIILMISVIFSAAVISAAAESSYIRGDADSDGTVIQRRLALLSVASFNEKAADVDGDGLNILDATRIQRKLAEFTDPYHIGETVSDNSRPTQDEYELPFVPN